MKKIVAYAIFLLVLVGCSEPPAWYLNEPTYSQSYDPSRDAVLDFEAAKEKARNEYKNVLIMLGGNWCSWCHRLNDYLTDNRNVSRLLLEHFVVVKVSVGDSSEENAFVESLPDFRGVPHFFVFSPTGEFIVSQETDSLEEGDDYSDERFVEFIQKYKRKT